MTLFVFWAAVALIAYHHVGYPILVRVLLALRSSTPGIAADSAPFCPTVTIIVPAHNEEAVIETKIRNLEAIDYPVGRLTAVIALDGCTDGTHDRAQRALAGVCRSRITLVAYQANKGKIAVLNDQIAQAKSEIVALTDASALVASDAIWIGVAPFADPAVGVVTGRYSVDGLQGTGEAAYWHYQSDVRSGESALAGPIGAHGAFYLFRRSAWRPMPPDTINDDFVLPMSIVLGGLKAVFKPAIVATELESSQSHQEFHRRVRIGAGNLQQAVRLARLCDPRRGWIAFAFSSGKGLRGILPFLLVAAAGATVVLAAQGSPAFALLACVEGAATALALWGGRLPGIRRGRLTGPLLYLLEGYLALTIGAALVVFRREGGVWRKSKRLSRN